MDYALVALAGMLLGAALQSHGATAMWWVRWLRHRIAGAIRRNEG